jgi:hypothetical protein
MVCARIAVLLTHALVLAAIAGCNRSSEVTSSPSSSSSSPSSSAPIAKAADAETADAPPIAELPVTMTLEQRSTTPVPGSDGKLSLTIDDITGEQVAVTVLDAHNKALAGPVSLTSGQIAPFRIGEAIYHLRLQKLSNALVGSDFATIVIDVPAAGEASETRTALTELEKIERLIAVVAAQENARFIRNGSEYTAAAAAEHLRTKLSAAGSQVQTAEDFIDQIGSRSSVSGQEYQIRMGDGRTMTTREFLQHELAKLETK